MLISNEVAGLIDFVLNYIIGKFHDIKSGVFLGGNLFHEIAINVHKD